MKRYETYTILSPQLTKEEVESFSRELENFLTQEKVAVEHREIKIHQPLGYPIKHQWRGSVLGLEVAAPEAADVAAMLRQKLLRNEQVLRHLTFVRQTPGRKPGEPESVIGELRRQARLPEGQARVRTTPGHTKEPVAAPAPSALPAGRQEKTKVDVEEIDRKIEELLK